MIIECEYSFQTINLIPNTIYNLQMDLLTVNKFLVELGGHNILTFHSQAQPKLVQTETQVWNSTQS